MRALPLFVFAAALSSTPCAAQFSASQCKALSGSIGRSIAELDKLRLTFEQQRVATATRTAPPGIRSAAEKVDAARDRLTLALSAYTATLEDLQAQSDICARR
ncbi:hypothetical protein LOK46_13475 [Methylobacterium sp. NMS14P]|uniref:hypothetical protein n=1 Tax=Methylobacterium sp. NMS14P TaxID=2894310 RepID=UPI00235900E9|nr:hypothetical protein [Methylobacterium sp. NMS14P]WCS27785.1 hypothetical protein LOK46_13475 [Methylobacterium sp. NMS14P]